MPGQFICPEQIKSPGSPARRKPGGAPHAAQDAEALFHHFTFSMQEAYQPT